MNLQQQVRADMLEAMKSKDATKTMALKSLIAQFTTELAKPGRDDRDNLSDNEVIGIIKRGVKQRKDSIDQFEKGGRPELAESEKAEMEVLKIYLPEMMSEEQIREIAVSKKAEIGVEDRSKMGILVGAVMKETAGQADGSVVSKVVSSLFD